MGKLLFFLGIFWNDTLLSYYLLKTNFNFIINSLESIFSFYFQPDKLALETSRGQIIFDIFAPPLHIPHSSAGNFNINILIPI